MVVRSPVARSMRETRPVLVVPGAELGRGRPSRAPGRPGRRARTRRRSGAPSGANVNPLGLIRPLATTVALVGQRRDRRLGERAARSARASKPRTAQREPSRSPSSPTLNAQVELSSVPTWCSRPRATTLLPHRSAFTVNVGILPLNGERRARNIEIGRHERAKHSHGLAADQLASPEAVGVGLTDQGRSSSAVGGSVGAHSAATVERPAGRRLHVVDAREWMVGARYASPVSTSNRSTPRVVIKAEGRRRRGPRPSPRGQRLAVAG